MKPTGEVIIGSILGKVLDDVGVNSLAVVDGGRSVLSAAILSSFLALSGGVGRLLGPSDVEELVDFDPQVVFLIGRDSTTILDALLGKDLSADVFLSPEISDISHPFLEGRDVYTYEVDEFYLTLLKILDEPVEVFRYSLPAELQLFL